MEVGTRVRVKPQYLWGGRIGVIKDITLGSKGYIAHVKIDAWPNSCPQMIFMFKLIDIGKPKPIKLKKFSAWK